MYEADMCVKRCLHIALMMEACLKRLPVCTRLRGTSSQKAVAFITSTSHCWLYHTVWAIHKLVETHLHSKYFCTLCFYAWPGDLRMPSSALQFFGRPKCSSCMPSINLEVSCREGKITHSCEIAVTNFLSTCYFLNGVQHTRPRRVWGGGMLGVKCCHESNNGLSSHSGTRGVDEVFSFWRWNVIIHENGFWTLSNACISIKFQSFESWILFRPKRKGKRTNPSCWASWLS